MSGRKIFPRWEVDSETGCWNWLLKKNWKGYGIESTKCVDGVFRQRKAHVNAWVRENGPVPDGKQIHHTCKNRGCVNAGHLKALTDVEHKKTHGRAVLARGDVVKIRELRSGGMGYRELGKQFGVRPDHIQDIMQGKAWRGA
jgi:hypothetical protein